MAKILTDRIGNPSPVWTVNPLITRQENVNSGVDNPAFYEEGEPGVRGCSDDPFHQKKQDDFSYTKKRRTCSARVVLLVVAICILLAVLMAMIAAVIYLAFGEVRTNWQADADFQEIEDGISLVEGHLRITNRVFTKDLLQPPNEAFRKLSRQITQSMDAVFLHSLQHYNETRVLSYSEGSVIVRCQIHLSKPRSDATHQVGMAVVAALERHHGYLPGGLLQVDIRSLHFTGLPNANQIPPEEPTQGARMVIPEIPAVKIPDTPTVRTVPENPQHEIFPQRTKPEIAEKQETNNSRAEIPASSDCGGVCEEGQVCLLLPQTSFSRCLVPRDADDPTGCGGWCVSEHQLCRRLGNATFQCTDNTASCREGQWQCENGLCIVEAGRCNGRVDCYDMSDEMDCECEEGRFRCGNSTPCLPRELRCDGHVDCWDASDEENCTKKCGQNNFTCNDGHCIPTTLFCDRFPDCADGSDEPAGCGDACLTTQKQCKNGRCVPTQQWCDSIDHCGDGSDEADCHRQHQPTLPSTSSSSVPSD